jgi:hypothetical protein
MPEMLVRALAVIAVVLCVGAPAGARASIQHTSPAIVLAQASPEAGKPDVTGHLPSATWLLVVVGIGLAVYISYRLGHKQDIEQRRREGPMSRALSEKPKRPAREQG